MRRMITAKVRATAIPCWLAACISPRFSVAGLSALDEAVHPLPSLPSIAANLTLTRALRVQGYTKKQIDTALFVFCSRQVRVS